MDITENKLQQLIIEEIKEVLGMDQEYTGSEMDVDAENDLAGALTSLQKAGYSHKEVIEMVNNEFGMGSGGSGEPGLKYVGQGEPMEENCGCHSCPEHGSAAKIRVKFR